MSGAKTPLAIWVAYVLLVACLLSLLALVALRIADDLDLIGERPVYVYYSDPSCGGAA